MNVGKIRRAYGLSRAEFAKFLGVHLSSIYRWEDGAKPEGTARAVLLGLERAAKANRTPERMAHLSGLMRSTDLSYLLKQGMSEICWVQWHFSK